VTIAEAHELLRRPEPLKRETERHRRTMVRLRRGEQLVSHLESLDLSYLLGGARGSGTYISGPAGKDEAWTDCSGFELYVRRAMGLMPKDPVGWTGTIVTEGHEGLSPYYVVLLKEPDQTEGHTIQRRRHKPRVGPEVFRWTECGGSDNPHPAGGPTWFEPTAERIAEFPYRRYFKALS
jgi:hypothetical protein